MALESNKDAILSGYIDAFCLVCETLITGEGEIGRHSSLPSHKEKLESAQLVEKFKDDQILKVKKGYYCLLCNLLFTTLTKVGLHVVEKNHTIRKGRNLLTRKESSIEYGDLLIDEKSWHGLVGDTCAVCNAEFTDEEKHVADPTHALNLVKNQVEFAGKFIYRKIDDTTAHCITCNQVLPLGDLAIHFDDNDHISLLLIKCTPFTRSKLVDDCIKIGSSECSENSESFNSAEGTSDESDSNIDDNDVKIASEVNQANILNSVNFFENNEVNINFENETALCKKCLGNIDFEFDAIKSHIDEHKRNPMKRDVGYIPFPCEADMRVSHTKDTNAAQLPAILNSSADASTTSRLDNNHNEIEDKLGKSEPSENKEDEEPTDESRKEFANQHQITYNTGINTAYCRVCSVRLPASLRSMREHVAGNPHRNQLFRSQPGSSTSGHKPTTRTLPMEVYVDDVYHIHNVFYGHLKVINEKFCISSSSFHMITEVENGLRCQVCELFLRKVELSSHVESLSHERLFKKVPVVVSFTNDFIREIRSNLFHCGYCNIMAASSDALRSHLRSLEHHAQEFVFKQRLMSLRPAILQKKMEVMANFLEMIGTRRLFSRF